MANNPIKSRALVARGPFSEGKWAMEEVTLREPGEDEVLVEMVASGLCHTDLHCGDTPDDKGVPGVYYPRVLGHEGSGYVQKVGAAVTHVQPGDAVLLSFTHCGQCHVCQTGPVSHCTSFFRINFMGGPVFAPQPRPDADADEAPPLGGLFFGQSSFAQHTIASAKSVVNVASLNLTRDELKLLAPFGCGLLTGSGTVVNVAKAGPDDAVVIMGMGGVGLAAVMAARNAGCRRIIGVDRIPARLALAKSLGATHTIDTTGLALPGGCGHQPLVVAAIEATRYMGRIIQVGAGMPDAAVTLPMQKWMDSGKQYFGAVMGQCDTAEYIPRMIRWWRDGDFPFERLVQSFSFDDYEAAIESMIKGTVVKPIMVW
ncbi:Alcohol dehydrogenase superfamily- zinc-type [Apiospora kogelbergensis]|uniref:Alcohol dehydrogenase superfamily- zinc-type n=1 Tax=Apiospora kogelbergensis TaxID=1337665 RepID=A0AAW0R236_9PEZI